MGPAAARARAVAGGTSRFDMPPEGLVGSPPMLSVRGRRGAPDRASATKATRAFAVLLTAAGVGVLAPVANADRIAQKRAEAARVLVQIRESNDRLERTIQQYDLATMKLRQTNGKIHENAAR